MSNGFWVKVNGKEIQNPVLRVVFLVLALTIASIIFAAVPFILMGVGGILVGAGALVLVLIIPHFMLRVMGRRGFFKKTYDETTNETSFKMSISGKAFRKVES